MTASLDAVLPYWREALNPNVMVESLPLTSRQKLLWQCPLGHIYERSLYHMLYRGLRCSVCSGKQILAGFNDFPTTDPHIASEYSPSNLVPATTLSRGSHLRVEWVCVYGHVWTTSINARTSNNTGCPYCCGNLAIEGATDLASQFPNLLDQWDFAANNINPVTITTMSNRKVHWVCQVGHRWKATVRQRVGQGQGCPYCSGRRVLPGFNDFATKFPQQAAQWHPTKNSGLPSEVTSQSHRRAWWLCDLGHEWECGIAERKKTGCPYCSGNQVLAGFNDLATKFPEMVNEWDYDNNTKTPTEITAMSTYVAAWVCHKGHQWKVRVATRTSKLSGCPQCDADTYVSKGEQELADFVESLGYAVKRNDRKVLKGTEVDIYLPDLNIGIEYNGLYWHSEATGKGRDYHVEKLRKAAGQGMRMLWVWEDEWQQERSKVEQLIASAIKNDHEPIDLDSLHPDYMLIVGKVRVPKYSIQQYQDDPDLKFEGGLTLNQLEDLNGLVRIWNYGVVLD